MKKCGNCGSKELSKRNQKGKIFPWRDYPAVQLIADVMFMECHQCNNVVLSVSDHQKLDEVIVKSIQYATSSLIGMILLKSKCTQVELSIHAGVSKEYLSEIKSGRKQPSFQMFTLLKILAFGKDAFSISDPKYELIDKIDEYEAG